MAMSRLAFRAFCLCFVTATGRKCCRYWLEVWAVSLSDGLGLGSSLLLPVVTSALTSSSVAWILSRWLLPQIVQQTLWVLDHLCCDIWGKFEQVGWSGHELQQHIRTCLSSCHLGSTLPPPPHRCPLENKGWRFCGLRLSAGPCRWCGGGGGGGLLVFCIPMEPYDKS